MSEGGGRFVSRVAKAVIFLVPAIVLLQLSNADYYDLIVNRIFDRLDGVYVEGVSVALEFPLLGPVTVDGNDAPAVRLLLENPLTAILGVGVGMQTVYANPYLAYESGFLDSGYTGYITPNLAVIDNLLNFGIVGCLFILFHLWFLWKKCDVTRFSQKQRFVFLFFVSTFSISFFLYSQPKLLIMSYGLLVLLLRSSSTARARLVSGSSRLQAAG